MQVNSFSMLFNTMLFFLSEQMVNEVLKNKRSIEGTQTL